MPLGTRDVMMVVRARDLASRTLRNIGTSVGVMGTKAGALSDKMFGISSAMTTLGIGIAGIGAAGVVWMNNSTDAAVKYNQEAAKTLTQVDQIGVSLETVKQIGRDVAQAIPAPFEEMQTSLYDIFSSMDVSVAGAKKLLTEFSRASVAGQVELQDAARGTIGILNAYELGADGVNRVNDVMFQLVRKGVGTYGEFAGVIGMATPAAVRAGQNIETLAGMMAFLTRNGLTASSAATSASRALENLADPRVMKRFQEMGIQVKTASGEFRPMVEVVGDLSKKLGGLPGPERAAALYELLKGAGNNVQARRFWNLAITNFDEFQQRVDEMVNSSGALDSAYQIMFEQPQSQIQLLKNNYEVLRTEIGDKLLPVKLKLAQAALSILGAWDRLDDGTKELIIKMVAIGSVVMTVVGGAMVLIGAIGGVIAVLVALGASLGGAIAIIGGVALALIAIPVIIFLIIKHFDTIKKVAGVVWAFIKDQASAAWQMLQRFWDWLSSVGVAVWHGIQTAADTAFSAIKRAIEIVVDAFKKAYQWLDKHFGKGVRELFDTLGEEVPAVLKEVKETFDEFASGAVDAFQRISDMASTFGRVMSTVYRNFIQPALSMLAELFRVVFSLAVQHVQLAFTQITAIIEVALRVILAAWDKFGPVVLSTVKNIWDTIFKMISGAVKVISNLIQLVLNVIQGDWGEAWENIKNIFFGIWQIMFSYFKGIWNQLYQMFIEMPKKIVGFFGNVLQILWDVGKKLIVGLFEGIKSMVGTVWEYLRGLPSSIREKFGDAMMILRGIGRAIIRGMWEGMKSVWKDVTEWLGSLPEAIVSLKGPPAKDAVLLTKNGKLIMRGLHRGLSAGWGDVRGLLGAMNQELGMSVGAGAFSPGATAADQGASAAAQRAGMYIAGDLVVREEKVVDDLDWFTRSRGAGI